MTGSKYAAEAADLTLLRKSPVVGERRTADTSQTATTGAGLYE
jgi:hypothetical protein